MELSKDFEPLEANAEFVEAVQTDGARACRMLDEYIQVYLRETALLFKVIPPTDIDETHLERSVEDGDFISVDLQPDVEECATIPFGDVPYEKGPNATDEYPHHRIKIAHIETPYVDLNIPSVLESHDDVRDTLRYLVGDDLRHELNAKFFATIDDLVGHQHVGTLGCGHLHHNHVVLSGVGICRDTVVESLKLLPSQGSRLEASTILINESYAKEVMLWSRDEVGSPAPDSRTLFGLRWLISSDEYIPNRTAYLFADEKFLGKCMLLQKPSSTIMYDKFSGTARIKLSMKIGAMIGNSNAVGKFRVARGYKTSQR